MGRMMGENRGQIHNVDKKEVGQQSGVSVERCSAPRLREYIMD